MSDEPKIINTEEDLKHARALETSNELDAMAATIRALWKERDALTNLGCKAVDLTTEISEGAGKEIAELRAMVDTKIEDVVTFCRGEADVVFLKTSHPVPLGTIDRIGKALREKLGKDTLFVLLEGDAEVEALSEKEMREQGWARADTVEALRQLLRRFRASTESLIENAYADWPIPAELETVLAEVDNAIRPESEGKTKPCPTCSGTGTVPGGFLAHVRHGCETCDGKRFVPA